MSSKLKAASGNLASAMEHPEVVSAYIQDEIVWGHISSLTVARRLNI